MDSPLKILFKLPSRGREERFFKALNSIVDNIHDRDNFHVSCTLDLDDEIMNRSVVRDRISLYNNVSVMWGKSNSKIHAINRSMPDGLFPYDIIVVASDDIFFHTYGFDSMIRDEMTQHFPNGDGYLHFKEADSQAALNVMTVIDKKYYDRFGYIYHPEYLSLFADNHQMDVAKILKRYIYIPYEIMDHKNPAYGYLERDTMFNEQQEVGWTLDQLKYEEMKKRNYDL